MKLETWKAWAARGAMVLMGVLWPISADAGMVLFQESVRWRNDDGSESAATWRGPVNDFTAGALGEKLRLRFCLSKSDTVVGQASFGLECAPSESGPWTIVPAAATGGQAFEMASSPWFANGDSTTPQLASSLESQWRPGHMVEAPSNTSARVTMDGYMFSNVEFCLRATSNAVVNQTYYFRLRSDPAPANGWDVRAFAILKVTAGSQHGPGDTNGDGVVNEADLSEVVSNFGKTY